MRLRIRVAAAVLCVLVVVALPGSAAAHAHHLRHFHNHLSITAAPDPIVAGDGVLVYGRLASQDPAGKTVRSTSTSTAPGAGSRGWRAPRRTGSGSTSS